MLQNIGPTIRLLRTQRGIKLNDFAGRLGVSPGYLSNLETGKTDTVQLSLLDKLHEELGILLIHETNGLNSDDFFLRQVQTASETLKTLYRTQPQEAEFLLSTLEAGMRFFKTKTN